MTHGEVGRDAEAERRLAHARPGRDDDEVSALEAGGEPIEVAEARWHACHLGAGFVEGRDPLEALLEERFDVREVAG